VRLARFAGTTALVVLTARQLAYALAPQPTVETLQRAVGGPGLVVTTLVVLPLGLAIACAVLWFASLGVRERHLLSGERTAAPRMGAVRVALDAVTLAAASCLAFSALESYIHWRAGLGFHGLHCLTGPVHRNAIPILCSLALLAAAVRAALRHVLAWMRRTIVLLRARRGALLHAPLLRSGAARTSLPTLLVDRIRVRGPPRVAVPG
jgi:hypothetical protein